MKKRSGRIFFTYRNARLEFILYFFTAVSIYSLLFASNVLSQNSNDEWFIYDHTGLPSNVTTLAIDQGSNVIWVGTDNGIFFDEGLSGYLTTSPVISALIQRGVVLPPYIFSVALDNDALWIAFGDSVGGELVGSGLARYWPYNSFDFVDTTNSGLWSTDVRELVFEPNGIGWAIPHGLFALVRFDGESWALYQWDEWDELDELEWRLLRRHLLGLQRGGRGNRITSLAIDHDGNKLIGFNGGVIWRGAIYELVSEITSVAIDSNGNIWAGTELNGIHSRINGEHNWRSYLPDKSVKSIALDQWGNPWVGMQNGLAYFDGDEWKIYDTENSELPGSTVYAVVIDQNGNKWIGTNQGLAVFNETGMVTSAQPDSEISNQIALHPNYPNPFNPSTTIAFDLPEPENVKLAIYDALGREITTLVSTRLSAGRHSFQWDAGQHSSGLYLYRLKAGSYIKTNKMVLLK